MSSEANSRPNILLIMADQFRTKSLTGFGDGIETPNIDRINNQALVFTRAACTAPLCTPSRASLATGKYPYRCGVIEHDADLPKDATTYYQLLRKSGYRVAIVGKSDLHKVSRYVGRKMPLPIMYHLGFTDVLETEGKMNAARFPLDNDGNPIPQGPYQSYLMNKDPSELPALNADLMTHIKAKGRYHSAPSVLPDEDFIDAFIGRTACKFLEEVDDDAPWHLFTSFAGPHNPWDPPKGALEKLEGTVYPETPKDEMEGKPAWVKARAKAQANGLTPEKLNETKRHYAASISVIDDYVGEMLDILESRGMLENTVIIFTADHGEMMGEHNLFEKTVMYEGALRVPLSIRCPGMKESRKSDSLAALMDLAPTILDLAGADFDRSDMDAKTLLPLLEGKDTPLRTVQRSELENTMMLFDGRYKWIRNYNDMDELYDLDSDPDELHNSINDLPEALAIMQRHLHKFPFVLKPSR